MSAESSSLPSIIRAFASPDVWHLPATYWFWHRVPTFAEIDRQLDELKQAGYGSFQIATRMCFPLEEYLGERYLAACKYAADRAAVLGLMIGIYDDYNWLSGHAGGRTVHNHDELRERHLFWSQNSPSNRQQDVMHCRVDGIVSGDAQALLQPGMDWIYEQGQACWDEWTIIAVYASPAAGIESESAIIDITTLAQNIQTTPTAFSLDIPLTELPYGEHTVITLFVSARCFTSRMINYLLPEAAENFIRVGYEPYADALGEHFGSTVNYMFFDQPHGCFYQWPQHVGPVKSSLMSSESLYQQLKSKYQGIRGHLMALVGDIGPSTSQRRCELFDTYGTLAIDAFFGTLSRWCQQHNLLLSGHEVLGHVSSWDFTSQIITEDARCNFAMNYFAIDAFRDLTAVDSRNSEPQMAAKFGDSVARAYGRSGCMIEQYYARTLPGTHFAAGQWEVNLHDLRRQAMRHHLLGARQFLMHAFWLTDGNAEDEVFSNPRFDFGPGVNFQPWFTHHPAFAQSSGRLSQFLDAGQPYGDVAIFYPLRTVWHQGTTGNYGQHGAEWAQWLTYSGYEYLFVNEDNLLQSQHTNGRLTVGGCDFPVLILPDVSVLASLATVELLENFVVQGGTLIISGDLPRYSQENGEDHQLQQRFSALVAQHPQVLHLPSLPINDEVKATLQPLKQQRSRFEHLSSDSKVWSRVSHTQRHEFLTIFNDGDQPLYGYILPRNAITLEEWLIDCGEIHPLASHITDAFAVIIKPYEVRCFCLTILPQQQEMVLDHGWQFSDINGNQQAISVDCGWETQGLADYGATGCYSIEFSLPEHHGGQLELYLPQVYGGVEVLLNGHSIGKRGWPEFRFMLPPEQLKAENHLTLVITPSAANHYYAGSRYQGEALAPCGLAAAPVIRSILS